METRERQQITEGVIWKQLLIFFFPILMGTFFQQMYNTVDTIIPSFHGRKDPPGQARSMFSAEAWTLPGGEARRGPGRKTHSEPQSTEGLYGARNRHAEPGRH